MIEHSKYYYDYDRNDINRKNPFKQKSKTDIVSILMERFVIPHNPDGHGVRYWITPIDMMVDKINRLYDEGHYIILMTAVVVDQVKIDRVHCSTDERLGSQVS